MLAVAEATPRLLGFCEGVSDMAIDRTTSLSSSARSATESVAAAPAAPGALSTTAARALRPYVAPKVRHLGSVRDLTLGTRNSGVEPAMSGMHVPP